MRGKKTECGKKIWSRKFFSFFEKKKNGEGEGGNLVREGGEKWKRKEKENILEKENFWQASEQMKRGSKNMKLIMIKMMMMPTKREETEAAPT